MKKPLPFDEVLKLAAFIPSYREGVGQGLCLLFHDGRCEWLLQGLRPFIAHLARLFAVDHRQARQRFGPLLGQVNLMPLALTPFLIFFPVKVRKPAISGDPAYGYLRLRSVTGLEADAASCAVNLEGGHRVLSCQSARSARGHLRVARKLEELLINRFCQTLDGNGHLFLLGTGAVSRPPCTGGCIGADNKNRSDILDK